MHQFSPKFVQDAATVRLRAFILPGVGGSRNRDAVEVALDRGFVEGVHAGRRSDMAGTLLNTHSCSERETNYRKFRARRMLRSVRSNCE